MKKDEYFIGIVSIRGDKTRTGLVFTTYLFEMCAFAVARKTYNCSKREEELANIEVGALRILVSLLLKS